MNMIKTQNLIYSTIALGIITFSAITYLGLLANNYNITAPDSSMINKTIDYTAQINQSYGTFNSDNGGLTSALGISGVFVFGANAIWQFIQLFLGAPDVLGSAIVDFARVLHLPAEIIGGIFAGIIAACLFGFYYFLTGRE